MNRVNHILTQFDPITLEEMDGVKLMDRRDTKFAFHFSELLSVLQEVIPFYRVLTIESNRISRYKTLYYDTHGFDLYHHHHSGKLNRYKIRHRTYVESELGFLEVKFKNNKGRTIKTRIREQETTELKEERALLFLQKHLPFNPLTLVPKILVNYSRITLVNKVSAERLTIDLNLEFETVSNTQTLNHIVIAEVKQDSKQVSPFVSMMKRRHIREGSISKYCFAIASTFTEVKKNNFKQKLSYVNKLINYDRVTGSK